MKDIDALRMRHLKKIEAPFFYLSVATVARVTTAAVFAFILHVFIAAQSHAITIELKSAGSDRVERQRRAASGQLPLKGTPNLSQRDVRLQKRGLEFGSPVLIRIFKRESELELWMAKDNRFVLFDTYPICNWSGDLGPKILEGDRQSPEGFYTLTRRSLHRAGRWPRSLNLGYPNVYDRSLSRTGSYILLHGGCSSTGCFAMTNAVMEEIFQFTEAALKAGQRHAQVHVFPFRMTDKNLAKHKSSDWFEFWTDLKAGYRAFEQTHRPLEVSVCKERYTAKATPAPEVAAGSPLAPCDQTVARLEAETLFASIANHPNRLQNLSPREKWLLTIIQAANVDPTDARKKEKSFKKLARTKRKTARPRRAFFPKVRCSLKRASCRKFVALMRKRVARKIAAAQKPKRTKRKRRSAQRIKKRKRY